jgi:hypothetical protein
LKLRKTHHPGNVLLRCPRHPACLLLSFYCSLPFFRVRSASQRRPTPGPPLDGGGGVRGGATACSCCCRANERRTSKVCLARSCRRTSKYFGYFIKKARGRVWGYPIHRIFTSLEMGSSVKGAKSFGMYVSTSCTRSSGVLPAPMKPVPTSVAK